MWGASPGSYKDKQACQTACLAYSIEENNDWHVVMKAIEVGDTTTNHYKACRVDDLPEAVKDHYYPIESVITAEQMNVKEPVNIKSFAPGDVAGFDLACRKLKDGSFRFNSHIVGQLPKEISCNGTVYTLEDVKEFNTNNKGETFINAIYV